MFDSTPETLVLHSSHDGIAIQWTLHPKTNPLTGTVVLNPGSSDPMTMSIFSGQALIPHFPGPEKAEISLKANNAAREMGISAEIKLNPGLQAGGVSYQFRSSIPGMIMKSAVAPVAISVSQG